ncbi:hypothetical protein [Nakamurella multipartita]|uniref:Integral membrane protein n=1 Tax=Nakamurella multipartita (strain ATCC 700099 / DSM 44233 / CIP 104796 / JCM 9543 / NBRC 105858 / Y-104) TaxID=479431 RepID=C8XHP5_NAKMY|nr:hypothetical protein [Nakamurella multipartita]ACV80348.1 hypothetical protein Namu_4058 [Nakamurella multipartita DSM 44233]
MSGETASATVRVEHAAGSVWHTIDHGPQARIWRVTSIVLLVLGCVLTPVALTAKWASTLVSDQDAYLAAVEPLATDPAIVSALENRLTGAIDEQISNLQLADKIGDELQSLGLPPKLATLATGYLATFRSDITDAISRMVDELVTSPKMAELWNAANAKAHTVFVQAMQGQYNDEVTKLHSVNVDLSQGAAAIKQKLESAGVSWANQIPDIPVVINLTGQADLQAIAGYYDLLNTLGTWLPWVALLLLLASILIAPSRLTGLARAGFWVAVSLLVLVVGAAIGREWLVGQSPLQPQVTEAFVASLLAGLRDQVRALIGLAAVIAAVSWLFGRSRSATSLRRQAGQAAGLVRDPRWQLAVRAGAGAAAVALIIWLLSMDEPRVLWAVLLVLLAGLAAFVALRPGEPATADAAGGAAGGADAGGGPADTRELVPVVDDRPTSPGVPPVTPTSGSSASSGSSADRPS